MDFRHLHLRGKLIAPSRIKAETVQVILIPRRIQTYERDDEAEPRGIGNISVSRERFEALLTMPCDALVPVLQMLIAKNFGSSTYVVGACVIGARRSKATGWKRTWMKMICRPMYESRSRTEAHLGRELTKPSLPSHVLGRSLSGAKQT